MTKTTEIMKAKPNAPDCSICDAFEDACSKDAASVVCAHCTVSGAWKLQLEEKKCPSCGKGKIEGWEKQCSACDKRDASAKRLQRFKKKQN